MLPLVAVLLVAAQQAPAFPPELVAFAPDGAGPVFAGGGPGAWDEVIRERGWVLREGGTFKLWYTGSDGTKTGRRRLGYATSADGVRWTRHPNNPLLPDRWVEDVMVVRDAGRYLMVAEGEGDRAQLLTSADGVAWQPQGTLDVRRTDGSRIPDGPFGTPTLFRDGDRWLLFYERSDAGVWLAASTDLRVWTHVRDEPVLVPGPAAHDRDLIALNQVVKHAGRYYAYYHGCAEAGPDARKWSVGVAVSDDLVRWQKYPRPLRPVGENKSSGILVDAGDGWRLWTMHPTVVRHGPAR